MIGYYRKFILNFTAISVLLTGITKNEQPNELKWREAQNQAFKALNSHTANPPILRLPVFVLQTDACNEGIGAICSTYKSADT